MATYRRMNSYGFLRLYRINPDGTSTQIASTAQRGRDGVEYLDSIEKQDRQLTDANETGRECLAKLEGN